MRVNDTERQKVSEMQGENGWRRRKVRGISQGWAFALGKVWDDTCRQKRGRGQALLRDKPHLAHVCKLYSPQWLQPLSQTPFSLHPAPLQNNSLTQSDKAILQNSFGVFVRSKFRLIIISFHMANLEKITSFWKAKTKSSSLKTHAIVCHKLLVPVSLAEAPRGNGSLHETSAEGAEMRIIFRTQ